MNDDKRKDEEPERAERRRRRKRRRRKIKKSSFTDFIWYYRIVHIFVINSIFETINLFLIDDLSDIHNYTV